MPVAERRRRGRPKDPGLPARRRGEILDAATALFAANGYRCTDLQDVADLLGVGKGTLYRYFPTKQVLFQAAVDRVMTGMREAIEAEVERATDPLDRIGRGMRAYLGYFDRHPEFVELIMQERAEFRDRKKPTYFEHREKNIGRWRELYEGLIAAGRVRDVPVDRITDAVSNLLYGAMFTNYFAGRKKTLADQADDLLDVLFQGILTEAERVPRGRARANGNGRHR
jgi:AcrR family transcriptional regulator